MEDTITIHKENETHLVLECAESVSRELSDYFSFESADSHYNPAYKNGIWDGRLKVYNRLTHRIYCGLFDEILKFASERDYTVKFDKKIFKKRESATSELAHNFYKKLHLDFEPYDFQIEGLRVAANQKRALLVSSTSSGKSALIYAILRLFSQKTKCLLIVPRVSLVRQMQSDFIDYSKNDTFDVEVNTHQIFSGMDKDDDSKGIYISTWHSIHKLEPEYFEQFGTVICDECHEATAECIKGILEKCTNARVRIGTTGSLRNSKTHEMVLTGLFGPKYVLSTTRQLIDRKIVSNLNINCLILKYDEASGKYLKSFYKKSKDKTSEEQRKPYEKEIEFITSNYKRNKFIVDLALSRKSNTLITFRLVEKHGKPLYEMLQARLLNSKRNVYFIWSGVDVERREQIRKILEKERDSIIVATEKIFSTGINIRNLDNLIFSTPSKARIAIIQSIGRILRKGDHGNGANVYDIVDDIRYKRHKNYALKHFFQRVDIYDQEQYDYRTINIKGEISFESRKPSRNGRRRKA